MNAGLLTSNTDMWSTPQDFYDKLNKEFWFNLDPCATDENHKCDTYFTKEQDGLQQDWSWYRAFINPPYWRVIWKWVEKASNTRGGVIVMLLPARTDTKRFHDHIYGKAEIRFIKWRLKFGWSKNSAPFPSMVVVYK